MLIVRYLLSFFLFCSFLVNATIFDEESELLFNDISTHQINFFDGAKSLKTQTNARGAELIEAILKISGTLSSSMTDPLKDMKILAKRETSLESMLKRVSEFRESIDALMSRDYELFNVKDVQFVESALKNHRMMQSGRDFIDQFDGVLKDILSTFSKNKDDADSLTFLNHHTSTHHQGVSALKLAELINQDVEAVRNLALSLPIFSREYQEIKEYKKAWEHYLNSVVGLSTSRIVTHNLIGHLIAELLRKENINPLLTHLYDFVDNFLTRSLLDHELAKSAQNEEKVQNDQSQKKVKVQQTEEERISSLHIHKNFDAAFMAMSMFGQFLLEMTHFCIEFLMISVEVERRNSPHTSGSDLAEEFLTLSRLRNQISKNFTSLFIFDPSNRPHQATEICSIVECKTTEAKDFFKYDIEFTEKELLWTKRNSRFHRVIFPSRKSETQTKQSVIKHFLYSWSFTIESLADFSKSTRLISFFWISQFGDASNFLPLSWSDPLRIHRRAYTPPVTSKGEQPVVEENEDARSNEDDQNVPKTDDADENVVEDSNDPNPRDENVPVENVIDDSNDEANVEQIQSVFKAHKKKVQKTKTSKFNCPAGHCFPFRKKSKILPSSLLSAVSITGKSHSKPCNIYPTQITATTFYMPRVECLSSPYNVALRDLVSRSLGMRVVWKALISQFASTVKDSSSNAVEQLKLLRLFLEQALPEASGGNKKVDSFKSLSVYADEHPMVIDALVRFCQIVRLFNEHIIHAHALLSHILLAETAGVLLLVTSPSHLGVIGFRNWNKDLGSFVEGSCGGFWSSLPGPYWSEVLQCADVNEALCIEKWKETEESKRNREKIAQAFEIFGFVMLGIFTLIILLCVIFWKKVFAMLERWRNKKANRLGIEEACAFENASRSHDSPNRSSGHSNNNDEGDEDESFFKRVSMAFRKIKILDAFDFKSSKKKKEDISADAPPSSPSTTRHKTNDMKDAASRRKSAVQGVGLDPRRSFVSRGEIFNFEEDDEGGRFSKARNSAHSKKRSLLGKLLPESKDAKRRSKVITNGNFSADVDEVNEFLQDFDDVDGMDSKNFFIPNADSPSVRNKNTLHGRVSSKYNPNIVPGDEKSQQLIIKKELSRAKERASIHDKLFPPSLPPHDGDEEETGRWESPPTVVVDEMVIGKKETMLPTRSLAALSKEELMRNEAWKNRRQSRKVESNAIESLLKQDKVVRREKRKSIIASVWSDDDLPKIKTASRFGQQEENFESSSSVESEPHEQAHDKFEVSKFVKRMSRVLKENVAETLLPQNSNTIQLDKYGRSTKNGEGHRVFIPHPSQKKNQDESNKIDILSHANKKEALKYMPAPPDRATYNSLNNQKTKKSIAPRMSSSNIFGLRDLDDDEGVSVSTGTALKNELKQTRQRHTKDEEQIESILNNMDQVDDLFGGAKKKKGKKSNGTPPAQFPPPNDVLEPEPVSQVAIDGMRENKNVSTKLFKPKKEKVIPNAADQQVDEMFENFEFGAGTKARKSKKKTEIGDPSEKGEKLSAPVESHVSTSKKSSLTTSPEKNVSSTEKSSELKNKTPTAATKKFVRAQKDEGS